MRTIGFFLGCLLAILVMKTCVVQKTDSEIHLIPRAENQ